jgi:predicted AlkP superfamily pyrophosphatase or phosphodiesterase
MPRMRRPILAVAAATLLASILAAQQQNPFDPAQKKGQKKPPPPNVAARPPKGPPAPKLPPQVVVISLDGVGNAELRQLYADGILTEDGFSRFAQEGEIAESMIPVDPTLTAPNHAALATGALPERTGIVSNHFHAAGSPPFSLTSGFATAIAPEAIWEAVRRQKKKAALIAWPDSDQREARRRGDWGLDFTVTADTTPTAVAIAKSDWKELELPPGTPKPQSYSPPLGLKVTLPSTQGESHEIELVAIDTTDNHKVDYDAVAVVPQLHAKGVRITPPFAVGEWMSFPYPGKAGTETVWAKLLAIDPSLATASVYLGGSYRTLAYPPAFAAQLVNEDVQWPGPPDDQLLEDNHRFAQADLDTWGEQAARYAAFFGDTLRLAVGHRDWDLVMGYIPSIDNAEHSLSLLDPRQEGFTEERRDAFTAARQAVWKAVDGEIRRVVASLDLSRTTVVLVSDHGMLPVHTALDLNSRLRDHGLLKVSPSGEIVADGTVAYAVGDGGVAHLYLASLASQGTQGTPTAAAASDATTLDTIRQMLSEWMIDGQSPFERVLTRHDAAEIGLDNPASGDLIVFANEGFAFTGGTTPHATDAFPAHPYGGHGYLSSHPAMRSIYLALGAGVKTGASAAVKATDLAPRIATWLGLAKSGAKPLPAH